MDSADVQTTAVRYLLASANRPCQRVSTGKLRDTKNAVEDLPVKGSKGRRLMWRGGWVDSAWGDGSRDTGGNPIPIDTGNLSECWKSCLLIRPYIYSIHGGESGQNGLLEVNQCDVCPRVPFAAVCLFLTDRVVLSMSFPDLTGGGGVGGWWQLSRMQ